MPTRALIMAGGRGERMRASGEMRPKPLVPVAGATLLERNVFRLLACGITDVIVAVAAGAEEVAAFSDTRIRRLVEAAGGSYERFTESVPLGNMGCAGRFSDTADELVVVYADNLTAISLDAMLAHHRTHGADLTLAAHAHHYRLPFGAIDVAGGIVRDYEEKPMWSPTVASGVSLLGPSAFAALLDVTGDPPQRPAGMVDLFHAVDRRRGRVVAFDHTATWVDVNDVAAVATGAAMVRAQPAVFEQWISGEPDPVAVSIADPDPDAGVGPVDIDDVDGDRPVRFRVRNDASAPAAPDAVALRARAHF